MKKENKVLKDDQGNDVASPRLSDNPSEEGEVKVRECRCVSQAARRGRCGQKHGFVCTCKMSSGRKNFQQSNAKCQIIKAEIYEK